MVHLFCFFFGRTANGAYSKECCLVDRVFNALWMCIVCHSRSTEHSWRPQKAFAYMLSMTTAGKLKVLTVIVYYSVEWEDITSFYPVETFLVDDHNCSAVIMLTFVEQNEKKIEMNLEWNLRGPPKRSYWVANWCRGSTRCTHCGLCRGHNNRDKLKRQKLQIAMRPPFQSDALTVEHIHQTSSKQNVFECRMNSCATDIRWGSSKQLTHDAIANEQKPITIELCMCAPCAHRQHRFVR